ncbi:hypothetical protein [Streptomyces sp. NRRL S-495]|uniref:hypothetical protein n=1 Tax=Streptomyces sp. NRRL S-495 TaxID=1609133 RepID=UPI0005F9248F|nr:hypothetical protein [Streptomyces sp. NRRL S-495]KJY32157.1 hypothetical protein VR45_23360 [Streptomyces sp. NRRL S-495]
MGSSARARIREMRRRLVHRTHRVRTVLRHAVEAVDVWIQDHHVGVVVTMLAVLGAGAWALLWTQWALVTALAKDLAPVLTIVSIIATSLLAVIRWFRKRRAARMARQARPASASVPRPRDAERRRGRPSGRRVRRALRGRGRGGPRW